MPLTRMPLPEPISPLDDIFKRIQIDEIKEKPKLAGKLLKYLPYLIKAKAANAIFNLGREDARIGPRGWLPGPTQIANTLAEHQLPYLPTVGRANPETDLGARASRAMQQLGGTIWNSIYAPKAQAQVKPTNPAMGQGEWWNRKVTAKEALRVGFTR